MAGKHAQDNADDHAHDHVDDKDPMISKDEDDKSILYKLEEATGGHGYVEPAGAEQRGLEAVQSAQSAERG